MLCLVFEVKNKHATQSSQLFQLLQGSLAASARQSLGKILYILGRLGIERESREQGPFDIARTTSKPGAGCEIAGR